MSTERATTVDSVDADSVDESLLEMLLDEQPERVTKRLREMLEDPEAGFAVAEQVLPYLERIKNDNMVREIIETGIGSEDPGVRLLFAERIDMMARRSRYDGYALLRKACLDETHLRPNLVLAGLRTVQRDAPEAYDFIVQRGLRTLERETKPGARERQERINRRFATAVNRLGW